MSDIIKLLQSHVANQIAAGEVVQRPSSVVKELLENAIDAVATSVKLIVKDGGKMLIQIVDDGIGMSEADARLSFERHATSKISSAEDLFNLDTKGFRGEALASIAAIAHVEMQTKRAEDELGTFIRIEGSKISTQDVIATPKGTSIAVKNLFFNIPARRNFLKSNQVEFRHITDEFYRIALAHPTIQFYFYNNRSELFNLPKSNLRQRIINIFGSKTNHKLVAVAEETQFVKIEGFICKPEFAKRSRGEQFFFVNNRFIKSPYLHHAIVAAFEGIIKLGSYPGYFLNLEVEPSSIDINIHPTKTEIKFDDEHRLYAVLKSAVKNSLGQFSVKSGIDFKSNVNLDTPYAFKDKNVIHPNIVADAAFNPYTTTQKDTSKPSYKKQETASWEGMYVGLESQRGKDVDFSNVSFESETITGSIFDEENKNFGVSTTFQLRRKYIVTTIKSEMVVIDQSRAHQRVLYEDFLKNITTNKIASQQLLFPLLLSFSKADITIVKEIEESLTKVGFIFSKLDEESIEVTGVPLLVAESEVGMVLEQLIADYQLDVTEESFFQTDILAKTLCKTLAVRTGELLDNSSQIALVNDLFACKEYRVSPFNKSIYIAITEHDIDKKFI